MKIKTNSRLYNIFILYKTLLEYFSTTVYLLSVISVTKTRKLLVLKPSESIHENSRFIRGNLRSRKISFANVNARKSTANLSVNTTFDIKTPNVLKNTPSLGQRNLFRRGKSRTFADVIEKRLNPVITYHRKLA